MDSFHFHPGNIKKKRKEVAKEEEKKKIQHVQK